MSKPKIGVILGSTRDGRFGDKPANWIVELGKQRSDIDIELIDLRDFPMPYFGEQGSEPHVGPDQDASVWRKKVSGYDGFIVTVAEYNHGPTGVLKNALDHARAEWARKPIAYVGYGGVGGARAIEHLRLVAVEQQMAPVRAAVHILWPDYLAASKGTPLSDLEHLNQAGQALLEDVTWWASALKTARDADQVEAKAAA